MISRRQEKLASLYQRLVSEYLERELSLEKIIVSITGVRLSEKLSEMKIYFSVWPDEGAADVLKSLGRLKRGLRRHLAGKVKTKFAPEISFHLDESEKKRLAIEELLNKNK